MLLAEAHVDGAEVAVELFFGADATEQAAAFLIGDRWDFSEHGS